MLLLLLLLLFCVTFVCVCVLIFLYSVGIDKYQMPAGPDLLTSEFLPINVNKPIVTKYKYNLIIDYCYSGCLAYKTAAIVFLIHTLLLLHDYYN